MSVALGRINQASARHCFSYRHCAFRRIRAAAQREQPDSNVNRRVAALLAASIPPAVQALAAEETDFSNKSAVPYFGVHSVEEEPPVAKTMVEQMGQLGAQIEVDKAIPTKVEDPNDPQGPPKEPAVKRQHLIVMRHGERIDEIDKTWSAQARRPYDPYLTPKGEEQAKAVAQHLKEYDIQRVYVSPFYRCLQTTMFAMAGAQIPPEKWTVTCAVSEFLNPWIMVKKGGKLPEGHINDWFWENKDMKGYIASRLPAEIASKVNYGQQTFLRFPENLLNSRARYSRAFQDIADNADGDNVLIVTHGDAVNSSVSRIMPWAIVYPVLHTGFTVAYRDQHQDGSWGGWVLQSRSGENGVWWTGKLRPVYNVAVPAYEAASSAADTAYGVYNRWAPSWAPFRSATTTAQPQTEGSKP